MSPKRVLVVDDEPAIREVAALSLEAVGGYDVLTAESGSDCFHQAAEQSPDAILLDVMMPEMDAPTTFATLQSDRATCDIPGDVFGEIGVTEHELRSASVVATSPVRLIWFSHWDVRRLRKALPEADRRLAELIEQRRR